MDRKVKIAAWALNKNHHIEDENLQKEWRKKYGK